MAKTIAEKILARHAFEGDASAGRIVTITPDVLLLNDVSGPIAFDRFKAMEARRVASPERVVLVADHFAPASDIASASANRMLREFASTYGIAHHYEPGRGGIEHALLAELGMVDHGAVVFGADSHTCTAGALNALGMGFGSADLAAALATGSLWLRTPETIRIDLTGSPAGFVTGKDVALSVTRELKEDGGLGAVLEFGGPGLAHLGMDERFAIANMAVEAGADACAFEGDEVSAAYLATRRRDTGPPMLPDDGAHYRSRLSIDLSALSPLIARPPSPASVVPVESVAGERVDQVYIGNCANGSLTDLRQAASILKGRRVAPGVRLIVVPATQQIMRTAMAEGLLEILAAAGAVIGPSTCGACFGGHFGILAAGETAVATTNRNFRGRMGHPDSHVFLASAWTAAAAAVAGKIVSPATLSRDADA